MNTPRTDAKEFRINSIRANCQIPVDALIVQADFARQLETECAELRSVLAELMEMRNKCFIPNDGNWWDDKARAVLAKVPK